jgi:2-C-methyl-D-erythritol 2,4-cyclodiphosphate synthase
VKLAGWIVNNVDSTVIAQAPKMAPHILAMRQRIATALVIPIEQVSVKAKTAEQMGPVGLGQAIEARAVCMLWKT